MTNLNSLKKSLKKQLAHDPKATLEKLEAMTFEESPIYNEIILLIGRMESNDKELLRNTISREQYDLNTDKINNSIIKLIDHLTPKDTLGEEDPNIVYQKLKALKKENDEISTKSNLLTEKIKVYQGQANGFEERLLKIIGFKKEIDLLKKEIEKLTKTNETKSKQISQYESQLTDVKKKLEKLSADKKNSEELRDEINSKTQQVSKYKNELAKLLEENKELKNQRVVDQSEINTLKLGYQEINSMYQKLLIKLDDYENNVLSNEIIRKWIDSLSDGWISFMQEYVGENAGLTQYRNILENGDSLQINGRYLNKKIAL